MCKCIYLRAYIQCIYIYIYIHMYACTVNERKTPPFESMAFQRSRQNWLAAIKRWMVLNTPIISKQHQPKSDQDLSIC